MVNQCELLRLIGTIKVLVIQGLKCSYNAKLLTCTVSPPVSRRLNQGETAAMFDPISHTSTGVWVGCPCSSARHAKIKLIHELEIKPLVGLQ
jgi:hypothetical protein